MKHSVRFFIISLVFTALALSGCSMFEALDGSTQDEIVSHKDSTDSAPAAGMVYVDEYRPVETRAAEPSTPPEPESAPAAAPTAAAAAPDDLGAKVEMQSVQIESLQKTIKNMELQITALKTELKHAISTDMIKTDGAPMDTATPPTPPAAPLKAPAPAMAEASKAMPDPEGVSAALAALKAPLPFETEQPTEKKTPEKAKAAETPKSMDKGKLASLKIKVLSGDGRMRTAKTLANKLQEYGYVVERVDLSPSEFSKNTIFFKKDFKSDAEGLGKRMEGEVDMKPLNWKTAFDIIIVAIGAK